MSNIITRAIAGESNELRIPGNLKINVLKKIHSIQRKSVYTMKISVQILVSKQFYSVSKEDHIPGLHL